MSFVCPLWNQVLYQTCVCERHTVTGPLSHKQTYTQVWRHTLTCQQKLCNYAPPDRHCTAAKNRKQTEHTFKEACVDVQIHMYAVNLLKKCLFPTPVSYFVSHKTGNWEGGHVQSILSGVPDPVGCLSSTAVTLHTRDTSLFSGYEVRGHKTKGRDIRCKISNTTQQEADI